MRTKVFLTPASYGKAGEVVGIEYEEASPLYAEPVPYWSANDAELSKLRTKVSRAETLRPLKQELDVAESPRSEERKRETGIGRDDPPPPHARQSVQVRNKMTWASLLSELDAKLATSLSATLRKKVCCTGQYLCTKCRAKATPAA